MNNKAAAVLAGAALLIGGLIGRASASDHTPASPKPKPSIGQALDPTRYPRTKAGAATAAAAYDDALGSAVLMNPEQRQAVIETISSDAMREQIAKDEEETVQVAAKVFDLPKDQAQVVSRHAPLGFRVVSFTNDSATVEIWSVTVLGKPGVGHGPISQFSTSIVDLAFERGAWRLAGTPQTKDGPTPVTDNPEASAQLLASVKDLQEFTHEAR